MRAYDFAVFFMALNASFWFFGSSEIFTGVEVIGQNLFTHISYGLIGSLLSSVAASAIVMMFGSRLSSPDIVAIIAFTTVFWFLCSSGVSILSSLYVPQNLLILLGGIQGVVFFIALIQMATKTTTKWAE